MSNSLVTPMGCSLWGSTVHGISQARNTGVGCRFLSRGSSRPRDRTCISCIGRWILHHWGTPKLCLWDLIRCQGTEAGYGISSISPLMNYLISPIRILAKRYSDFSSWSLVSAWDMFCSGSVPRLQANIWSSCSWASTHSTEVTHSTGQKTIKPSLGSP